MILIKAYGLALHVDSDIHTRDLWEVRADDALPKGQGDGCVVSLSLTENPSNTMASHKM